MGQAPSSNARRSSAQWALAMLFIAAFLGALSVGLWTANWVVLRSVYDAEVIEREQLTIVHRKPFPQVSNGDRLEGWGFPYFLIACVVWLPVFFALLPILWMLMPKAHRGRSGPPSREHPPDPHWPLVWFSPPFIAFLLVLTVGLPVAFVLVAVIALAVAWTTAGRWSAVG